MLTVPEGWPCNGCRRTKPFADLWAGYCSQCRALFRRSSRTAAEAYQQRRERKGIVARTDPNSERRLWSEEEMEILRNACANNETAQFVMDATGRSFPAVIKKYYDLGIRGLRYNKNSPSPKGPPPPVWAGERLKQLKKLYNSMSYEELGALFGCTAKAISGAVHRHLPPKKMRRRSKRVR